MHKLCTLVFVICCAVLAVVSAYPSSPIADDNVGTYQEDAVPIEQLRVARAAAADPHRGHGRGRGHGRYKPHGGYGGHGGFGRPGGFGGSNAGSNANSASYSQSYSSPFGSFSASGSQSSANSFAGGHYGRR